MLYLSHPPKAQSTDTQRALHAADGYLFFRLFDEALEELESIDHAEQDDSAVLLARIRVLLHTKKWDRAESLSRRGAGLHPEEGEFTVQRAFALHQLQEGDKAFAVLLAA